MRKFKAKRNRTIFRSNTFLLLNIFFFFGLFLEGGFMCVFVFFWTLWQVWRVGEGTNYERKW